MSNTKSTQPPVDEQIAKAVDAALGNYPFVSSYYTDEYGWIIHTNAPNKATVQDALNDILDGIEDAPISEITVPTP